MTISDIAKQKIRNGGYPRQVWKDHFDPVPSAIMQRFKFNSCIRAAGESVPKYVAVLSSSAEHYQYKDTLKEMLRDLLVCGINHDGIQQS